jgi:hypothetical protein
LTTDGFSLGSREEIAEEQQDELVVEVDGDALASYFDGGEDDCKDDHCKYGHNDDDDYSITNYTTSQYNIDERINHFMGRVPISANIALLSGQPIWSKPLPLSGVCSQ